MGAADLKGFQLAAWGRRFWDMLTLPLKTLPKQPFFGSHINGHAFNTTRCIVLDHFYILDFQFIYIPYFLEKLAYGKSFTRFIEYGNVAIAEVLSNGNIVNTSNGIGH